MKTVAQIGCRSFKDMSQVYQIFCNLIINYKFNEQRCKRAYEIVNARRVSVVADRTNADGGMGKGQRIQSQRKRANGDNEKSKRNSMEITIDMDGGKASSTTQLTAKHCTLIFVLAYPLHHSLCMR